MRLLSLAAGTMAEFGPVEVVEAASAAGWPAAGIWFDAATWTERTSRDVRAALDRTGVVALDIEPVIVSPDGDDHGERLVDAGAEVGARFVLFTSRHPDPAVTIERYATLCDRAAEAGITVVVEFLPIFAVRSLGDAAAIVRAAGRPNGGVLVDTLHLVRSGGVPDDLATAGVDLPYLQIADAPAAAPDDLRGLYVEAVDGRLLPGEGALPNDAVLAAVPAVALSFEIRSATLRSSYPDPVERARVVLGAAAPLA